jgi:hypothetical protein
VVGGNDTIVSDSVGGGAVLRLRTPGKRACSSQSVSFVLPLNLQSCGQRGLFVGAGTIASVHAAGAALPSNRWNATDESIAFAEGEQMAQLASAPLRVCYS